MDLVVPCLVVVKVAVVVAVPIVAVGVEKAGAVVALGVLAEKSKLSYYKALIYQRLVWFFG
jgi:hypothetical protein